MVIPVIIIVIPVIGVLAFALLYYFSLQKIKKLKIKSAHWEEYFKLITNTPFMGFVMYEKGKITSCNQEFLRMLGVERDKVIGLPFTNFVKKKSAAELLEEYKGLGVNYYLQKSNNIIIDVLIYEREIEIENTAVTLVTISDISKAVFYEKKLLKERQQLAKSTEVKTKFLANVSHEIRTPLNGIVAGVDLMVKNKELEEKYGEVLEIIQNSAKSLKSTIADILDISKIESGSLELNIGHHALSDLIKNVQSIMAPKAKEKNLNFTLITKGQINVDFLGDGLRIKQILFNFIDNAIKFTHSGDVVLEVVHERLANTRGKFTFFVKDTGIGIKNENDEIIYDYFTQLGDGSTKEYMGLGLGLSVCKNIAQLMGGKVYHYPNEPEGTVFAFEIELKLESKKPEGDEVSIQIDLDEQLKNILNDKKLLLVEDNKLNQRLMQMFLKNQNIELVCAQNGEEALKLFEESNGDYDLIFMDIQMPIMDGLEATRRIRDYERIKGKKSKPILALTANAMQGDKEDCLNAGMQDFLSKPFKKDEISSLIIKYLD